VLPVRCCTLASAADNQKGGYNRQDRQIHEQPTVTYTLHHIVLWAASKIDFAFRQRMSIIFGERSSLLKSATIFTTELKQQVSKVIWHVAASSLRTCHHAQQQMQCT